MNQEHAIETNMIEVCNIKKKFKVYNDKGYTLKEKVIFSSRNKYEERWVLKGISFQVKKGEAVGLIGHNGCGKSTTLKMLTKIMYPDAGSISLNGRVSSLLELGAGFHPDLSGRENIYINASIFGLTKAEIDNRAEDIIRFSELEEFIDHPVRTYSSGMYMRLAFSVAIHVDADILLIDEILGVGDTNFQVKCFQKLMEIKQGGTSIVIVSHSLGQIEQICERSIWIHDGLVRAEGMPGSVHRQYLAYMGELRNKPVPVAASSSTADVPTASDLYMHTGSGEVKIAKVSVTDQEGEAKRAFLTAQDIRIHVEYTVSRPLAKANVGISIFRNDGLCCYGISTKEDGIGFFQMNRNGSIELDLKNVNLLAGKFIIHVGIEDELRNSIDYVDQAASFEIYTLNDETGAFYLEHKWKLDV
ncbi:MAG: ABC transporter ATP-binding protein [Eubacterium sp.]|nr:ABC transporter ATP-binding protein [Eubacterium sp.]